MKRDTFKILAEKYESVYTEEMLREAFDKDLKLFEQYLIQEGLWDTIKQKGSQLVGGAKNALIQPLVKMVLNQIAQSDPEGYKRLQAAAQNPQQLQALLNSPEVQQQQQAIGQDVAATAESIADDIYYEYLNEAYGNLVDEAWIDPKTGRFVKAGTPGAVERKTATSRDAAGRFVKNAPQQQPASPAPVNAQQQPASPAPVNAQQQPASPQQGPGTALNPGQHGSTAAYAKAQGLKVAQRTPQQTLGQKVANTADKAAIAGLKGIGKAGAAVGNLAGKGIQALGQTKAGEAAGGFISKAVNWVKQHPKISLAAGLALLAATGGAAAIGAGGIAPLITSTLSAGAAGAAKGGIAGTVFGGIKNLAQQAQDAKSLKDINWKQAGKEALKAGGKGAAIGAAVGAGANVLGKAAAGVGKISGVGGEELGKAAIPQGNDTGLNDPSLDGIKAGIAGNRAREIVDTLMNDKYGNLVDPYDIKFAKDLNLYDVFNAADIKNNVDPQDVMRVVKMVAQQDSPEKAAELLSKYIVQGTKNLGISPENVVDIAQQAAQGTAQQAAQDTAQQAAQDTANQASAAALAAKQAVAAEKAAKGLEWVANQAERFRRGAGFDVEQLRDILGSVGQGASRSQTEQMIRQHLIGRISKEGLESYFTKLAMRAL